MTRDRAILQARSILAEHCDSGILLVTWTDAGDTFHAHAHFGNDYAAQQLAARAEELLFEDTESETPIDE